MDQMEEYDARIISGASKLFRMYGIRAVTMDAIASHLGISKRSIYERFTDKETLLYEVIISMNDRQREMIDSILENSPDIISAIFTFVRLSRDHDASMNPMVYSDLKKYHSRVLKRVMEVSEDPNYEAAGVILRKGISQGIFREDIDVDIVIRGFRGISALPSNQDLFPPELFLHKNIVRNLIMNFMRGISTARGIELIDSMIGDL